MLPDITLLGKVLGGGFPVGAVAGRRKVMDVLDPKRAQDERVEIFGTYSGNVAVMAAGLATLDQLADGRPQKQAAALAERMRRLVARASGPLRRAGCCQPDRLLDPGLFRARPAAARTIATKRAATLQDAASYHIALMTQGVFFKPGSEGRVSAAHTRA